MRKYIAFDLELPTPDRDPHDLTVRSRECLDAERNGCCLAKVDAKTFAFTEFTPARGSVKSRLSSPIAHVGDLVWIEDAATTGAG